MINSNYPAERMEWLFPLNTAIDRRWKRKSVSRRSPVWAVVSWPSLLMNDVVPGPTTPEVSKAMGWKIYLSVKPAYFLGLTSSAFLETDPGSEIPVETLLSEYVSEHVQSHTRNFPRWKGYKVIPSGRLPSPRPRPIGSSTAGNPAASKDLFTIVLSAWWRGNLPALRMHESGCLPNSSMYFPHLHRCGVQIFKPKRRQIPIRRVSLSSLHPMEEIGIAYSHAPECGWQALLKHLSFSWSTDGINESPRLVDRMSSHCRCDECDFGSGRLYPSQTSIAELNHVDEMCSEQRERTPSTRVLQNEREERYAGRATSRGERSPMPPFLMGSKAILQLMSSNWMLQILSAHERSIDSSIYFP